MPYRTSTLLFLVLALAIAPSACGNGEVGDLPRQYEEYLAEHGRAEPVERPVEAMPEDDLAADPGTAPEMTPPDTLDLPEAVEEEPPFDGTAESMRGGATMRETATLHSVRAARNPGFDRVVFEFVEEGVPGYQTSFIDRPVRECGSGRVIDMPGEGWLAVRLAPAGADDIDVRRQQLDLPGIEAIAMTCDSGGQVEWVLALRAPNRYRVITLAGPGRVVVDVLH